MTKQSKNSEIDTSNERWVREYKEEMKQMEERDPEGYSAHPLYQALKRRVEPETSEDQARSERAGRGPVSDVPSNQRGAKSRRFAGLAERFTKTIPE